MDVTTEAYRQGVTHDLRVGWSRPIGMPSRWTLPSQRLRIAEEDQEDEDNSPGMIDRLAKAEEALPQWLESVQGIGYEIEIIGRIMQDATTDINKSSAQGKGFAHRLAIARQIAKQLGEPTEKIWTFGNEFASQLHAVDEGFHAIIERAPVEITENPESEREVCQFFEMIRQLSASAHEGLGKFSR